MHAGTLDLLDLPLGQTVRVTAQHHGLVYTGEVVRANAWEPSLGEPLKEDQFIQVVQASDVSGLVNVLDQRLVKFVREVLSGR